MMVKVTLETQRLGEIVWLVRSLLADHAAYINHDYPGGLKPLPLPDEEMSLVLRLNVIEAMDELSAALLEAAGRELVIYPPEKGDES